jgi:hypothetical protein
VGSAPIVAKLVGGHWVRAGTGVFNAAYGPGNWIAEQAGTMSQSGPDATTLTISGGKAAVTVHNATDFSWAPADGAGPAAAGVASGLNVNAGTHDDGLVAGQLEVLRRVGRQP